MSQDRKENFARDLMYAKRAGIRMEVVTSLENDHVFGYILLVEHEIAININQCNIKIPSIIIKHNTK